MNLLSVSSTMFTFFLVNRIYCLQVTFLLFHVVNTMNPKLGQSNLDEYQSLIKSSFLMINMGLEFVLGHTVYIASHSSLSGASLAAR